MDAKTIMSGIFTLLLLTFLFSDDLIRIIKAIRGDNNKILEGKKDDEKQS